ILTQRLQALDERLNRLLAQQYGIDPDKLEYEGWRSSHQPFHWFVEFYGILNAGGFDVVIGNPPYVTVSSSVGYSVIAYETTDCKDLYALVMERSIKLAQTDARFGMIIPVSSVSTDGFVSLRKLMRERLGTSWISSYAERPSKLFTGVEKRLTIWIAKHQLNAKNVQIEWHISGYRRWLADEREFLFSTLQYVDLPQAGLLADVTPKIYTNTESTILYKLQGKQALELFCTNGGKSRIYYTRQVRYFAQFFDFIPRITDASDAVIPPSELKEIPFADTPSQSIALAFLNSSLFFWFLSVHSDVRNLNRREIYAFPSSLHQIDSRDSKELQRLSKVLMDDFTAHSHVITNNYKKYGTLNIQSFQPRLSKPIIDQIDSVLARHYGFSDEELDYIINYDIKYRMGDELFSEEEGEE
ncbi:MAG: Eco57I restriction-modification methylase domain-containing protein, partial [Caldilineaceae bacterium]|nr:Eco57I restriction-modification methylase domain-containing protein [Caldilineaceae bacterium]